MFYKNEIERQEGINWMWNMGYLGILSCFLWSLLPSISTCRYGILATSSISSNCKLYSMAKEIAVISECDFWEVPIFPDIVDIGIHFVLTSCLVFLFEFLPWFPMDLEWFMLQKYHLLSLLVFCWCRSFCTLCFIFHLLTALQLL